MFTEEEIQHILAHVIEKDKEFNQLTPKKKIEAKAPEYYPEYPKIVEIAERLSYHYDLEIFPEKILRAKAPNQSEEEFEYAKMNYKPITVPFWGKAESAVNRIWNKDNFSIKFPDTKNGEEDENSPKLYFKEQIPFYRSILNFMENIATPATLRDPNSIIAIKPKVLPQKTDENGDFINDQSELIEPIPIVYRSDQIVSYEQDVHAMVLLDVKSLVSFGGRPQKLGNVYAFYDDTNIWKLTQVGDKKDNKYDIEIFYAHELGKVTFMKLSGKPVQKKSLNYNISHFMDAVPNLDDAIANFVTLMISIYTQAFPQRWEIVDRCKAAGCINGKIQDSEDAQWGNCSDCDGTGIRGRHSPTGVHQVELPSKLDALDTPPTPSFGYVSPDIAILDFLKKYIHQEIVDAWAFLNIDVSNSDVKGAETALGKQIDREEFFSFLIKLSNQMFHTLEWQINIMGKMRYGDTFEDPSIIKPTNFSIRSFKEITEEMAKAKESGIPDIAITKLLEEYASIRFNTDKEFGRVLDLAIQIDKLVVKSNADIISGVAQQTITKKDVIIHNCFIQFIEMGRVDNKDFLSKTTEEIAQFISEQADLKLAEQTPNPRTTDEILIDANVSTNGATTTT